MSTSPISTSLLSQIADSPTAANQFVTDLNQLAKDLQSGNLSAAQQDYVTLSQDALDGVTSSAATNSASGITTSLLSDIASSSTNSSSFVSELNNLGTDLQSGNLSAAQQDLLSLDSTALGAASATPTVSIPSSSGAGTTSSTSQADMEKLIQAIVQAMGAGDTSAASSDLAQLASVSGSSQGASYLQGLSASLGSGSSSGSSSIGQLLQSLNDSGSSNSSILSELA